LFLDVKPYNVVWYTISAAQNYRSLKSIHALQREEIGEMSETIDELVENLTKVRYMYTSLTPSVRDPRDPEFFLSPPILCDRQNPAVASNC
jgi:hypothetical protein